MGGFDDVGKAYRAFTTRVSNICRPARYKKFGAQTLGLDPFITAVTEHLDSLDQWFTILKKPGVTIFQNADKITGNQKTIFKKLDDFYMTFFPILDIEVKNVLKIPER